MKRDRERPLRAFGYTHAFGLDVSKRHLPMQAVRAGRSDTCTGLTQKCVSHKRTRPALTPRPWATVCAVGTEQNITSPGVSPATDQGVPITALLYARHVRNNPINYVDPSGHVPELECEFGYGECPNDSAGTPTSNLSSSLLVASTLNSGP